MYDNVSLTSYTMEWVTDVFRDLLASPKNATLDNPTIQRRRSNPVRSFMVLEDGYFVHEDESMQEGFVVEGCETGWVGFVDKYENANEENNFLTVDNADALLVRRYRRRRMFRKTRNGKGSKGKGKGQGPGRRTPTTIPTKEVCQKSISKKENAE